jgi:hypothetical protein
VIARPLRAILASDLLRPGSERDHIQDALAALADAHYYDALVAVRKALFLEIEADYAVDEWRTLDPGDPQLSSIFTRRGHKSSWYTRGKTYVQQYVHTPFDYVVLDHERVQLDLMAWGVPLQDFWNVWRLTPRVFQYADAQEWLVEHKVQAEAGATKENASYCIDRAISILLGKQRHWDAIRSVPWAPDHAVPVRLLRDQPLYEKASETSSTVRLLYQGDVYRADALIPGLDGVTYVHLFDFSAPRTYVVGYVPAVACDPITSDSESTRQEGQSTD